MIELVILLMTLDIISVPPSIDNLSNFGGTIITDPTGIIVDLFNLRLSPLGNNK